MTGSRPSSDGGIFVSGRRSERRVIRLIYKKGPYFILILGNVGDTSERRDGAHNYGLFRAHRYHLKMN